MKTGSRESPAKGAPSKRPSDPDDRSEPMSDPAQRVPEPAPRDAARPDGLDGFRVEVDAARERVDIILDRPPLNVITMTQREQLRDAFHASVADRRGLVIVLHAQRDSSSSV